MVTNWVYSASKSDVLFVWVGSIIASPIRRKTPIILDYTTPLSLETKWLGMNKLSFIFRISEEYLCRSADLILASNEMLAHRAKCFGGKHIIEISNYPPQTFKPSISPTEFKQEKRLPEDKKIGLVTLSDRLNEIYGIDLLFESWKIVERNHPTACLVIVGPSHSSEYNAFSLKHYAKRKFGIKNLLVTGWTSYEELPNWINIADVCIAPRTPGFPTRWYNHKDSTKISEYAAMKKPIVATGYSPSKQYLLTLQTSSAFSEGILRGLAGKVPDAIPHYWSENIPTLLNAVKEILN